MIPRPTKVFMGIPMINRFIWGTVLAIAPKAKLTMRADAHTGQERIMAVLNIPPAGMVLNFSTTWSSN